MYYDGFLDRSLLSNNFSGESILSGRRFYLGQKYQLKKKTNDTRLQPYELETDLLTKRDSMNLVNLHLDPILVILIYSGFDFLVGWMSKRSPTKLL